MKRGRKAVVSVDEQKKVFLKYKDVFGDFDSLPSPNDPVYMNLSSELNYRMSVKSLYLSLKKNYNQFFEIKCENLKQSVDDDDDVSYDSFDSEVSSASENTEIEKPSDCEYVTFYLDIYAWEKIKPIVKYVKRNDPKLTSSKYRRKWTLSTHEWAGLLREELWKKTKTHCTWIFKSSQVKPSQFVTCNGSCKECKANIHVKIVWPTEKIVLCECTINNKNENFVHIRGRKVKLSPPKRRELSEELRKNAAVVVRNSIVDSVMETGDIEPTHVPNLGVLRKIKYDDKKSSHFDNNQIVSLWLMTKNSLYNECIRYITIHPFFVMYYWSKTQETYYNNFVKKHQAIMSFDATGSIFKEFGPRPDAEMTKHLFLYVCVMQSDDNTSSVPISQMISENQTLHTIAEWLKTWSKGKKAPEEVICDDSAALIGAAVQVFTKHCSTREYLNDSYELLENNQTCFPNTQCYIRIDTSHFIKILYNLTIFKHVDKRVTFFYVNCLKRIKACEDYETIKGIVKDMVSVCLSKYAGYEEDNKITSTEKTIRRLKQLPVFCKDEADIEVYKNKENEYIESDTSIFYNEYKSQERGDNKDVWKQEDSMTEVDSSDSPEYSKVVIQEKEEATKSINLKWLSDHISKEKLIQDLSSDNDDYTANLYYLPLLIDTIIRLISRLPLWSNVMNNVYNSNNSTPTSSNVEAYFKNIKSLMCDGKTKSHRSRVDDFITQHQQYISGETKLAFGNMIEPKKILTTTFKKKKSTLPKKKTHENDDSVFIDRPTLIENWKNKATGIPKKKRNKNPLKKVPVLLNGSLVNAEKNIISNNTCAFDSLTQSIAIAYKDGLLSDADLKSDDDYFKLIKSIANDEPKNQINKDRNDILKNNFETITVGPNVQIRCDCNISYIVEHVLCDKLYSADETKSCTNSECSVQNYKRRCPFLPLNLNIINNKGISAVGESAQSMLDDNIAICNQNNCNGVKTISYSLSKVIFLELTDTKKININDVPKTITLNKHQYQVASLIDYTPPVIGDIGHYKANCLRYNKWKCYDDMKTRINKSQNYVTPHCIMYIKKKTNDS